ITQAVLSVLYDCLWEELQTWSSEMASGTALIYDEEMTNYKLLWVDPACSIETPERLTASHSALQSQGLAQRCVPATLTVYKAVILITGKEYLEAVKKTPGMTLEELKTFTLQYGDVYFHPNIYHCAKLAVGAVLQLVDSVMTGQVRNGMALVRPPGHHSQRSVANGFCVFNNVAIAVLYAKKNFNINRVLIVDWDIHHGQGIQYLFEEDPSVLYFSWHRYEHQKFWPNLSESDYDTVGTGKGAGFNINLPWNKVGMENADYLSVFFHVLLPIAYEFSPDLVMVSAGFDSAVGDPEGHMCATPDVFAHLTHLLMPLAGGRLCVVLEVGVLSDIDAIKCIDMHLPNMSHSVLPSAVESIQNVRAAHQQYWGCLKHIVCPGVQSVSEPSTKRSRVGEGDEGVQETPDAKEAESWVGHYPEPPLRVAPPTRTAVVLPADLEDLVPQSCQRVTGTPLRPEQAALGLSQARAKGKSTAAQFNSVSHMNAPAYQRKIMLNLTMFLGLMVLFSIFFICLFLHFISNLVYGQCYGFPGCIELFVKVKDHGKIVIVAVSDLTGFKCQSSFLCIIREPISKAQDPAGFLLAVLSLIVPIAYEFCPGLVLAALGEGSGIGAAVLAHFTSLLQGLAQGQLLCLIQEGSETKTLQTTSASLLGEPAPYLGSLAPALPENSQAVERQRRRLQTHWRMLQTAGEE
uniref:Histone deacetylase 10 n=1 Tax=Lepisosteus oculatus TaxID=7918 RepID=W5NE48_LEPOC